MQESELNTGSQPRSDRARLLERFGRSFSAGEVLFRAGDPAKYAFLLHGGEVRLCKQTGGLDSSLTRPSGGLGQDSLAPGQVLCARPSGGLGSPLARPSGGLDSERSLMVLQAGELFGEAALCGAATHACSAVALSDGVALLLDRETFDTLSHRHPAIAIGVVEQLAERLRAAQEQIEILMLPDEISKVVYALLKCAGASEGRVQLSLTPLDLSRWVALEVEQVKRVVLRLHEQGYLELHDDHLELLDVAALSALFQLLGAREEIRGARAR